MEKLTYNYKINVYGLPQENCGNRLTPIRLPFGLDFGGRIRHEIYVNRLIKLEAETAFDLLYNRFSIDQLMMAGIVDGYDGCFSFTSDLKKAWGISLSFRVPKNKALEKVFVDSGFNAFYKSGVYEFEIISNPRFLK